MRAVVYDAFGEPPRVDVVRDPEPPPHGAVVRVSATGLCRSDWHGWMGHDPDITAFPHVPGHELAGRVEAVGPEVRRWAPGARVTVPFVCACGDCEQCAAGNEQVCDRQRQPGFTHWGSYAELVALDWADVNLVALPDGVDDVAAAGLGCRFATAYRAVVQVGRLQPGEWLAVHGCGGVGLSAVMIGAALGARVVGVDVAEGALAAAREAGAEATVPAAVVGGREGTAASGGDSEAAAAGAHTGAALREATRGGAHLSLDAIGHEAALAASVAGLRRRGRHVQVGLLPDPPRVPMDLVIARELELLGSHGMAARSYPELLALVEAGRLRPGDLVTREIGLDEAPAALTAMGEPGQPGVTVIRP